MIADDLAIGQMIVRQTRDMSLADQSLKRRHTVGQRFFGAIHISLGRDPQFSMRARFGVVVQTELGHRQRRDRE